MQTDQPFPIKVRLWLNHKVVLSYKTQHYKNQSVAESLRMCQDIAKMVRANCSGYNTLAISRMILMYQKHLQNILPHPNNSSYQSSVTKLEQILTIAQNNLQNEKFKIS